MLQDGLQKLSKRWGAKASTPEISQVVQDYINILADWHVEQVEMPASNPWSWSDEQLQDEIGRRRNGETNCRPEDR